MKNDRYAKIALFLFSLLATDGAIVLLQGLFLGEDTQTLVGLAEIATAALVGIFVMLTMMLYKTSAVSDDGRRTEIDPSVEGDQLPQPSAKEISVLTQLVEREHTGLELVAGGMGVLVRNTLYVLLGQMEDKGLIEGREEVVPGGESKPPRRMYRMTAYGQRVLAAHRAALHEGQ